MSAERSLARTYVSSLWTDADVEKSGLDFQGNFLGDDVRVERLIFSDGTILTTAATVSFPNFLDGGTF